MVLHFLANLLPSEHNDQCEQLVTHFLVRAIIFSGTFPINLGCGRHRRCLELLPELVEYLDPNSTLPYDGHRASFTIGR